MNCPRCNTAETKRLRREGRRHVYKCSSCDKNFSTLEQHEHFDHVTRQKVLKQVLAELGEQMTITSRKILKSKGILK